MFETDYSGYDEKIAAGLIRRQTDYEDVQGKLKLLMDKYLYLKINNIDMKKIFSEQNLNEFIMYGYGRQGKWLKNELKSDIIKCIYDKKFDYSKNQIVNGSKICSDTELSESELPIIITPFYNTHQIIAELMKRGIKRKRIIPLSLIIDIEFEDKLLKGLNTVNIAWNCENTYLITGAQFKNKGAQSMLFVAMSELRQKHPDCQILFMPVDGWSSYSTELQRKFKFRLVKYDIMDPDSFIYRLIPQISAIIDVGGYALSSNWNSEYVVQIYSIAELNDIPLYLMPQSYGPFDFEKKFDSRVKKGLEHAKVVFAREYSTMELLREKYGLKNVRYSNDLVLQNKKINWNDIYACESDINNFDENIMNGNNNVGIVPNIRNYEFGNKDAILKAYYVIINYLIKCNKNIVIFPHSDDIEACNDIYNMFKDKENVKLYSKSLECYEYSKMVKKFEFLVVSRYHAIVHAYKENIPCVAIGWSEKYYELLEIFEQSKYVIDVRKEIDCNYAVSILDYMNSSWREEKCKIKTILSKVQEQNCFDIVE